MSTGAQLPHNKGKFILITCCCIVLVYGITQYFLLKISGFNEFSSIIDSIVSAVLVGVFCLGINTALNFYVPSSKKILKILGIGLICGAISILLTRITLSYYVEDKHLALFDITIPYRFIVNFLIINSVSTIVVLWNIQEDNIENIKHKQESEKSLKEAELYNLRQQLQPHFLFNSLNSIIALIDQDPSEARDMTFKLSDFLRGTMRKDNNQMISLEDELEHLHLYLDIEKVRFGHRLHTSIQTDLEHLNYKIPAMLIQPIVENAIKHGLYNIVEEVDIKINCTMQQNQLIITVANPFDSSQQPKKGTGFGLSSIARRLYLLYGRSDLLKTNIQENIFICTIQIPQL